MTLWNQHAKGADRSQRFHRIERELAFGFDLSCARGDVGHQFPNQVFAWGVWHGRRIRYGIS